MATTKAPRVILSGKSPIGQTIYFRVPKSAYPATIAKALGLKVETAKSASGARVTKALNAFPRIRVNFKDGGSKLFFCTAGSMESASKALAGKKIGTKTVSSVSFPGN